METRYFPEHFHPFLIDHALFEIIENESQNCRKTMSDLEKSLVIYILKKQNDIHPFRISRILLLFEMEFFEKTGEKPTEFIYRLQPYTFYIENFQNLIEEIPIIEKKKEVDANGIPVRGYLHLSKPDIDVKIPLKMREILDRVIEQTRPLDDQALNQYVVSLDTYKKLYEEFGD